MSKTFTILIPNEYLTKPYNFNIYNDLMLIPTYFAFGYG